MINKDVKTSPTPSFYEETKLSFFTVISFYLHRNLTVGVNEKAKIRNISV